MRNSLSRIKTLTGRNIKEILRDPLSLILMILLPLFMEILFYFIFHNLTSQFEMKYLAPGIVVFSQAFLALFTGQLISLDRASAFLTRLFVSKARPHEFILGYAAALVPVALVQSVLFFLVGGIIDPSIFGAGMIRGVLLSIVTSLFFIAVGILLGSVCGEKAIGGAASIIVIGQSILSGMWFPIDKLSEGFIFAMRCFPFKNATDLIQNVLNGVSDPADQFWTPLLIVLAYTAAVFIAAILCFKAKMKEK